ncbi:MAG: DUF333 domain-containing protein [Candidatus Paceibacterota bacterium]|jgi:putative hemolysin
MKKVYIVLILIIVGLGISFAFNGQPKKDDVGIANPASVFCVEQGGRLDIRTDTNGGQTGFCVFEGGPECEEWAFFRGECRIDEPTNTGIACTEEAKICPDGSAVGRIGRNCEFAPCPNTPISGQGTVSGKVTLSPTCPVERIPPDPNCAPKPYAISINILKAGGIGIIKTIKSDVNGAFSINLDSGTFILRASGGAVLPRCADVSVKVVNGQTTTANISCDTGIR